MKKTLLSAVLALGLLGLCTAKANQITGSIGFGGMAAFDTTSAATATKITSVLGAYVLLGNGDYAGIPTPPISFTPVAMQGFTFDPVGSGVAPLWTIVQGATTYSFDLTAVSSVTRSSSIAITGIGVAHITGFEDTPGAFNISADPVYGTLFTFSTATHVTGVPDGGATVALLGLVLMGVEGFRRKLSK